MPWERAVARIVGNRRSQNLDTLAVRSPDPPLAASGPPRCRASSHMCGRPVSRIRRMIALATTSRGARSASSCTPCMKRVPPSSGRPSTRTAPSPRTASEISGCWPRDVGPRYITVGWNCTNSRSRRVAPARSASAIPSPVDTAGLVVWENTWPSPPLASTTARQCTAPTPSRWPSPITCRVTPATPPASSSSRSRARACWITSMSGARSTAAVSARWISAPVASPPACAIRSRWWPPSRVSASSPSGSWSNLVPSAISSRTASGPSVTSTRTASRSQAPAPATSVSTSCCSGVSPGPSAAAMPPCAHCVEPAASTSLVTTRTEPTWWRSRSAAVRPAMPEPITTTSARVVQPGEGAARRPGTRRTGASTALPFTGSGYRPASTSPRTRPAPPLVSTGSEPVATILLSASTNTTCGRNDRASSVSIWP